MSHAIIASLLADKPVKCHDVVTLLREHQPCLREQYGVVDLALFGSVARDEAVPDSDINILVKFEHPPTLRNFFGTQHYLEDVLGRMVDLSNPEALSQRQLQQVEKELIHV